jgi:4-phytase/acid phosphatase
MTTAPCFPPGKLFRQVVALSALAFLTAPAARAAEADGELRLVIILSRHGVRAPLDIQQDYAKYSAQPWPKWDVPAGNLTPHGRTQMELMGGYYRARYVQAGLLSGHAEQDAPLIFFRANNLQRTLETARALGAGLLPGASPEIHARPAGETDPLFQPVKVPLGHPDRARGVAAMLGRVGGDLRAVELSQRGAFATLERVLLGESGEVPAGKTALLDLPTVVAPGAGENMVSVRSPLATAGSITDSFMLEYANGLPMSEVGWGRLTPGRLTELLELHALWFELVHATFDSAQAEASNLASHLGDTLRQAATGRALAGALGGPGQKMIVIAGHDTNQINLGGLLGLTWWLPGTQRNPVLLGGALVFELREQPRDHQFFVRAYYVSPTLEQTRALDPLTLEHPPAVAPIFIPDCSNATPGFDAPLPRFEALLRRVIDPQLVAPSAQ